MKNAEQTPRTLFILIARNDERRIADTLASLEPMAANCIGSEILLIDDASSDQTLSNAQVYAKEHTACPVHTLKNKLAQGYGGNLKAGFRYAIDHGFDVVLPLSAYETHAPQALATLLQTCKEEPGADAVLGYAAGEPAGFLRRLLSLTPWAMHHLLCGIQNRLAQTQLNTWHTTYRAYRTRGLLQIAFELNSAGLHFDTEVLLQFIDKHLTIREAALPIRRGSYSRQLYSLSCVKDILKATLKYKLQKYNLFYDVRYHPEFLQNEPGVAGQQKIYREKFAIHSPHSFVCNDPALIPAGSNVLDIGCSTGYVAQTLAQTKGCRVTGVDLWPAAQISGPGFDYHQIDIENDFETLKLLIERNQFDIILLLDVIEHLAIPEKFMLQLYKIRYTRRPTFVISTPNVAFAPIRLMLLLGYFNYGEKGILDVTHKRLFTLRTFKNLFDQTGFIILNKKGFPVPFRDLGFPPKFCRILEKANRMLIHSRASLFAYQIMFMVTPIHIPTENQI